MKSTIVLGSTGNEIFARYQNADRLFYYVKDTHEGILYHLDNPEVDSYIIISSAFTPSALNSAIQHIHYLNTLITIIIWGNEERKKPDSPNIHLATEDTDISGLLEDIPQCQRGSNRIEWPLRVEIRTPKKNYTINSSALSISSGGCFIMLKEAGFVSGDEVTLTFHFKGFNFFAEGHVVRTVQNKIPAGVAVQFQKVSPQTQKCIQEIINEKLLAELMHSVKSVQSDLEYGI